MKNRAKQIISALILFLLLPCFLFPVSANSAQTYWEGRYESGLMTTDGDCPIVVEHETLTFDLHEFPNFSWSNQENVASYSGKVSAEYTFYNPSDMTVTAKMAFPMANTFQTYPGDYTNYIITVNGQPIETEMRHTLSYYNTDFDIDVDLPRLVDEYVEDDFFSQSLQATLYTITLGGLDETKIKNGKTKFGIDINPKDYPNVMFYFPDNISYNILEDGTYRIYGNARFNGQHISFYAIGQNLRIYPEVKIYEDWHCNDNQVMDGWGICSYAEDFTLADLIFEDYDESRGISRMDWYNANIEILKSRRDASNPIATISSFTTWHSYQLTTWYCYEVTLSPGERITNKITAPIYPDVNTQYKQARYTYNYLLSPAATWADFGTLDIYINTPYYVVSSSLSGFEKTDEGYKISLDGLPRDKNGEHEELSFTLCTEEPSFTSNIPFSQMIKDITYFFMFYGPVIMIASAVLILLIIIFLFIKRRF